MVFEKSEKYKLEKLVSTVKQATKVSIIITCNVAWKVNSNF